MCCTGGPGTAKSRERLRPSGLLGPNDRCQACFGQSLLFPAMSAVRVSLMGTVQRAYRKIRYGVSVFPISPGPKSDREVCCLLFSVPKLLHESYGLQTRTHQLGKPIFSGRYHGRFLACAEYEVGIREQSPDSRSSLAILPMYDPGLLTSFDRRRLRFRLLQRGGTTEGRRQGPCIC